MAGQKTRTDLLLNASDLSFIAFGDDAATEYTTKEEQSAASSNSDGKSDGYQSKVLFFSAFKMALFDEVALKIRPQIAVRFIHNRANIESRKGSRIEQQHYQ